MSFIKYCFIRTPSSFRTCFTNISELLFYTSYATPFFIYMSFNRTFRANALGKRGGDASSLEPASKRPALTSHKWEQTDRLEDEESIMFVCVSLCVFIYVYMLCVYFNLLACTDELQVLHAKFYSFKNFTTKEFFSFAIFQDASIGEQ